MKDGKIQIYQLATNPACASYRFDFPAQHLNKRQNLQVTKITKLTADAYHEIVEFADILIVQRLAMSLKLAKLCYALRAADKLVVFEIDDDLMNLHPESRYAGRVPDDYCERVKQSILACHAIQCATPVLAEKISEFHPQVVVLQNQLDKVQPLNQKADYGSPIIIAYAAGEDHLVDWFTIKDAFNQTITHMETSGNDLETWIIGDEDIFASIQSKKKRFFPLLPRQEYLQLLRHVDISIVPLADHPFNRSKSDIKFLESAACGAAVIASSLVYSETIKDGETGLLFNSSDEFSKCLIEAIKKPQLIKQISVGAHRYVSENRLIEQHIHKWEQAYLAWFANRESLLQIFSAVIV